MPISRMIGKARHGWRRGRCWTNTFNDPPEHSGTYLCKIKNKRSEVIFVGVYQYNVNTGTWKQLNKQRRHKRLSVAVPARGALYYDAYDPREGLS